MKLVNDPWQFEEFEINSVPVHYKHWPNSNQVTEIRLLVLAGSRHDPVGQEGLAHFMEHLPFNGSRSHSTLLEIREIKDSLFFGSLGACTDMESTTFSGKVLNVDLLKAAAFFADFVRYPLFNDLEREKGVIRSEIWRKFGNSRAAKLTQRVIKSLYSQHRLSRSGNLGWVETIQNLEVQDFSAFHERHYHRGNLRLVFVGDAGKNMAQQAAEIIVKEFLAGEANPQPVRPSVWLPPLEKKLVLSREEFFGTKDSQTSEVRLARVTPAINRSISALAGDILREILFRRVRGQLGDTYSPNIWSTRFADVCELGVSLAVPPEKLATARDILLGSLMDLGEGTPESRALFASKKANRLITLKHNERTAEGIANDACSDLQYFRHIQTLTETLTETEELNYETLAEFVNDELAPPKLFEQVLTP